MAEVLSDDDLAWNLENVRDSEMHWEANRDDIRDSHRELARRLAAAEAELERLRVDRDHWQKEKADILSAMGAEGNYLASMRAAWEGYDDGNRAGSIAEWIELTLAELRRRRAEDARAGSAGRALAAENADLRRRLEWARRIVEEATVIHTLSLLTSAFPDVLPEVTNEP